ncbi:MAG: TolC family protein [bacterium]|nr:TolC family protein [bacterium]
MSIRFNPISPSWRDEGSRRARWLPTEALFAILITLTITFAITTPIFADAVEENCINALPGADAPLLLDDALQEALAANAGLQAQRMRIDELRGQMVQARAIGLPSIDVSGTWMKSRDPSFALNDMFSGGDAGGAGGPLFETPPGADPWGEVLVGDLNNVLGALTSGFSFSPGDIEAQSFWRAAVSTHWDFRPTLVYNAVGAAGLGLNHQESVVLDAERQLGVGLMTAYYGVIRTGETLAALDADLAAKDEFLNIVRHRFELGMATELDTLRAAVDRANLLPTRRSAAQALRDTASQLNILMGRPALNPLSVVRNTIVETDVIDPDLAVTRLGKRPDIRQMTLLEEILRKNRGAQRSDMRPYLSVDASYGYVGTEAGNLMDDGHDTWSTSVTVNVPIFDGLLTRGKVKETEASIRRTHYQREDALRNAHLELHKVLGDLTAAHESMAAAELNLLAADNALEQTTQRYQSGKADYLNVLNAQSARLMANSNLINTRFDVLTLTASLKRLLGFDPGSPLSEIAATLHATNQNR